MGPLGAQLILPKADLFLSLIFLLAFENTTQTPVATGSKGRPGTKYEDCTPLAGCSLQSFEYQFVNVNDGYQSV
jgi:hypothetical protein